MDQITKDFIAYEDCIELDRRERRATRAALQRDKVHLRDNIVGASLSGGTIVISAFLAIMVNPLYAIISAVGGLVALKSLSNISKVNESIRNNKTKIDTLSEEIHKNQKRVDQLLVQRLHGPKTNIVKVEEQHQMGPFEEFERV